MIMAVVLEILAVVVITGVVVWVEISMVMAMMVSEVLTTYE